MNHSRLALLVLLLAGLAACQPKTSAVTDNSPAIATVNGAPISLNFYDFYIKGITGGKAPADLTAEQRGLALDNLIRAQLVAEQAVKDGVDKSGDAAYMLQLARLNVLEQAVQERYLKDRQPSEQELRAEYEAQLSAMPKTEYHARHILVATEPFAQKIVDRLDKGEKFDVVAKAESMDSSKNNGGDLGWFTANRMVPQFAAAVMTLKPNEYTHKPVETQYGWHVIQLLETREVTAPPFDQVRQRRRCAARAEWRSAGRTPGCARCRRNSGPGNASYAAGQPEEGLTPKNLHRRSKPSVGDVDISVTAGELLRAPALEQFPELPLIEHRHIQLPRPCQLRSRI